MPKLPTFDDDPEVRDFVDGLDRTMSYDAMAAACLDRFGPQRAWSRSKIVRRWRMLGTRRSKLDRDPEVRDFIDARAGRLTIDEIRAEGLTLFGERMPSRSVIGRHTSRLRRGH